MCCGYRYYFSNYYSAAYGDHILCYAILFFVSYCSIRDLVRNRGLYRWSVFFNSRLDH